MVKEKKGWDEGFRENADLSPASQAPEFSTKGSHAPLRCAWGYCSVRLLRSLGALFALISASQPRRPIRN